MATTERDDPEPVPTAVDDFACRHFNDRTASEASYSRSSCNTQDTRSNDQEVAVATRHNGRDQYEYSELAVYRVSRIDRQLSSPEWWEVANPGCGNVRVIGPITASRVVPAVHARSLCIDALQLRRKDMAQRIPRVAGRRGGMSSTRILLSLFYS